MKKMNTKSWAVFAVAALVVVGGAWAVVGTNAGDSLSAAVLKAPGKPIVLPGPSKTATTTAATTTKPVTPHPDPRAVPVKPVAAAPVKAVKGICKADAQQKSCEEAKINAAIDSCRNPDGCTITLRRAPDGTLVLVQVK